MISMAQLSRHRTDAATVNNKLFVGHTYCVRQNVHGVNVENAQTIRHTEKMEQGLTMGAKLRLLREQSGRSMREIAKFAGYKGASGIQRYFDDDYDTPMLPIGIAAKLAKGFRGSRTAPEDVMKLAGVASLLEANTFNPQEGPHLVVRDIPVYGTALGSLFNYEGGAVEQTYLDTGEVISYFARPQALNRRKDVYGVYIQGSSMSPRFQEGEIAFVEDKRPPQIGDDVVVFLVQPEGDGERVTACLIKRLVRRSASYIELEQFNPPLTFKLETSMVHKVHRVIPWGELLA